MSSNTTKQIVTRPTALLLLALLPFSILQAAEGSCEDVGEFAYLCGPDSAEDLVVIPGTDWIIASGFGKGASLYLIDAQRKTWSHIYPGDEPRARQNMETYGGCPGSPDPNRFVPHGLNIRGEAGGQHSTLYVVGHGEREAIEVFDIDASSDTPLVTWTGCVLTPEGMEANSVASLADGSLLVTIPLHTGVSINESFTGKPTGAAYAWSPGDDGFEKVAGTELPYANGIEASADGKEFYIASSGLRSVLAYSNTRPSRLLRRTETLSFVPDNLHMNDEGKLITAGMAVIDPVCGDVPLSEAFDLVAIAREALINSNMALAYRAVRNRGFPSTACSLPGEKG